MRAGTATVVAVIASVVGAAGGAVVAIWIAVVATPLDEAELERRVDEPDVAADLRSTIVDAAVDEAEATLPAVGGLLAAPLDTALATDIGEDVATQIGIVGVRWEFGDSDTVASIDVLALLDRVAGLTPVFALLPEEATLVVTFDVIDQPRRIVEIVWGAAGAALLIVAVAGLVASATKRWWIAGAVLLPLGLSVLLVGFGGRVVLDDGTFGGAVLVTQLDAASTALLVVGVGSALVGLLAVVRASTT